MYLTSTPTAIVRRWMIVLLGLFLILFLDACSGSSPPPASDGAAGTIDVARAMTVYRSPDCSCCHAWADLARADGWTVASADVLDMTRFKAEHGLPPEVASCHTAIVGDYVVEGHVPLAAIERLLADRPEIDGIALPGMPAGSPGMGGAQVAPFEVVAFVEGEVTAFGSY